ncbi:MAG: Glucose-6-phosphate isomerase [Methanosaeta sp. PtaU1.Bin060]|jgi:glucose-6-phosphate isomerase|nr:MAG: Glucose-6-phosphate isomerase [Methanosaeta sp. PtaU1.Bin060]
MEMEFGGKRLEPDIRWLYDMLDVIYDQAWLSHAENFKLYYMYRDLFLSRADRDKLLDQGLRYDITIIPPAMLGIEYIKTAGHYHPLAPGGSATYPELYEVLEGEALYLLQKQDLSKVVVVNAKAGDKVLVPPNYGHITINRSNKTLKMANLVARSFSSLYDPIRERHGGAYFFTKDGWIKNERSPEAAMLQRSEAPDGRCLRRFGLSKSSEIYPLLREPGILEYLTDPQKHLDLFEGLI